MELDRAKSQFAYAPLDLYCKFIFRHCGVERNAADEIGSVPSTESGDLIVRGSRIGRDRIR
jgi:hypothetical protein